MEILLTLFAIVAILASYIAMVYARTYIATFRNQTPVTFWGNLTHGKSWLAILGSTLLTVAALYALLTAPFAAGYHTASQVLLGATVAGFVASGLCLTVIDLRTMKLPTKIIYPTLCTVFALLTTVGIVEAEYDRILSMVIGSLGIWLVMFLLWYFIPGGFGFGDVRLMLLTGAILGWLSLPHVFIGFMLAFVTMSIIYIPLMVFRIVGKKTRAPFGPWIIFGTYLSIVFGDILSNTFISGGLL